MSITLTNLEDIVARSDQLIRNLGVKLKAPSEIKQMERLFRIGEVAAMVGRTPQAIRAAESANALESPDMREDSNRRKGYTLEQIEKMREHFGTKMVFTKHDTPRVLSFLNFKGGVGKSTTAVHVAQALAQEGIKVLFMDMDPQASSTALLGYEPDIQISVEDTVAPFIDGEQPDLRYAIRKTYWHGLDLIPSCLQLYGIEYSLAARAGEEMTQRVLAEKENRPYQMQNIFTLLSDGIQSVIQDYDVVIIDPPPALGMISINVLYASNCIVIPMPLGMLDFLSTTQFYRLAADIVGQLEQSGMSIGYHFIKILPSRKKARTEGDPHSTDTEDQILRLARKHYGSYMMDSIVYESKAVKDATAELKTLFELEKPSGSPEAHRNAVESMRATCDEILMELKKTWPSFAKKLNENAAA